MTSATVTLAPHTALIAGVTFNGRPVIVDTAPRNPITGGRMHVSAPCGGWCRRCMMHDDPGGCLG